VSLPFWREADAPDRQGITEIRQIEGMYAFFDALLERFPKLTSTTRTGAAPARPGDDEAQPGLPHA